MRFEIIERHRKGLATKTEVRAMIAEIELLRQATAVRDLIVWCPSCGDESPRSEAHTCPPGTELYEDPTCGCPPGTHPAADPEPPHTARAKSDCPLLDPQLEGSCPTPEVCVDRCEFVPPHTASDREVVK
jgi:hypothetical protein